MADVTVTTDDAGTGDNAAFAAGVATVTAAQASEDAEVAVEQAQQAQTTADVAVDVAGEAANEAYDARTAVEQLRDEVTGLVETLRASLSPPAPVVVEEPPTEAAPEPTTAKTPPKTGANPPEAKGDNESGGYGSPRWFGR